METLFPSKLAAVFLTLSGLNPHRQNRTAFLLKWGTFISMVITIPLVLLKMFDDIENIDVLAPTFESLMTCYQISIRWLTFSLNNQQYAKLLDETDANFWQTRTHRDERFFKRVKKFSQRFDWSVVMFILLGGFGCFCFAIKPFLFGGAKQVPLLCWVPGGGATPYYELIYFVQIYVLFMATFLVGGFDLFYVSIAVRYIIQFRLLRYEFERLGDGDDDEEVEERFNVFVKYHVFLLGQLDKFLQACSFLLLNQYLAFIITLCMELFILTETNDPTKYFNCLIYICLISLQAGLFCIPPTILEDETSKVASSIYFSKWYNIESKPLLIKTIVLVMRRSQFSIKFNAGGLFAMNVQCLTNILNTGISFYTLMKNRKHA